MRMNQQYLDRAESAFFERELESIKSRTFDIKYPQLMANRFVPVNTEANAGATEVTYRQFDRVGKAEIIARNAPRMPRVDVFGSEFPRPTRPVGASYGYDLLEIRAAAMAGRPLNARRAAVCRRAVEEKIDEVVSIGAPEYGIETGFINDADIAIDAAAGVWSAATADAIIADVSDMWQAMVTDTKGIENRPNTLILPDAQWALISTLPRSTQSDTTVREFLMRAFPSLTMIEPWYRLDTAGAGGVDRGILYNLGPDNLEHDLVNPFEQLPVHQQGLNFEVNCFAVTAGMAFYYPRSARYIDGI
jgi:hypothetical protein